MPITRLNPKPRLTLDLLARRTFAADPLVVLDVGASLGIEYQWRLFGDQLRAVGFDALASECDRLNGIEELPGVRYVARWIRDPRQEERFNLAEAFTLKTAWPYSRTTMVSAGELLAFEPNVLYGAGDTAPRTAEETTSIDEFVRAEAIPTVDYIKIDTDGSDIEALLSAETTLGSHGVLGVRIEAPLHGPEHPFSNTWSNIDRVMRERGFSLFDFDRYRLSRSALPDRFVFKSPSATYRGQVAWVDALYLRDVAHPGYLDLWLDLAPMKLAKIVCLFEVFGLDDCAAEVLLGHRERLSTVLDVDAALDILAEQWLPECQGFAGLTREFVSDPGSFFPTGRIGLARPGHEYES